MTALGFIGVLLSLLALRWAFVVRSNTRIAMFFLALILHVGASAAYYVYVQSNDSDAYQYYFDPYRVYGQSSAFGTAFTITAVQTIRAYVGGTYLDFFLLFQTFGFWGIILMMRTIEEVCIDLRVEQPAILYLGLLLPGTFFWTSAIGKDAPLFLGCALVMWTMMRLRSRWPWFGAALVLMVLFRPHMAIIAAVALILSVVIDRKIHIAIRSMLVLAALGMSGTVVAAVQEGFAVNISNAASVVEYVENQQRVTADTATGDIAGASYFVKLISLLFRPLFFDASGLFGLIASVQNLFVLFAFLIMIRHIRKFPQLFRKSLPFRFALLFFVGTNLLLSALYYNVGLGLRQREMATPSFLFLFAVIWIITHVIEKQRRRIGA